MPETITEQNVAENQQGTPETQVNQEQNTAELALSPSDLDGMTEAELQEVARGNNPKSKAKPKQQPASAPAVKPEPKPAASAQQAAPEQKPDPAQAGMIEIDIGNGKKLKYRNPDELKRAIAEQHKLIDKYNGERGKFGSIAKENETAKAKITELTEAIKQLREGQKQVAAGQTANPTTQDALAALQKQQTSPGAPDDLKATIEQLRGELAEVKEGFNRQESQRSVDHGVKSLYSEIDGFINSHPEYKLSQGFADVDELVSKYGKDAAQSMVDSEDWNKYWSIMEVVGLYKNSPENEFDIKRKNFDDFDEAFLIHQKRNGSLAKQTADAMKQGLQNYETALTRGANSATTLPNSTNSAQQFDMGPAEAEKLIQMDVEDVKKDPVLFEQWKKAMAALGIKAEMVT